MNRDDLLSALNWRYATKKFDAEKKLTSEDINVLEESLRLSPSSFGLQPWKFVVVTNQNLKDKLKEASWGQGQLSDCSHVVVLARKKEFGMKNVEEFISLMAKEQGSSPDDFAGYKGVIEGFLKNFDEKGLKSWTEKQIYIALGFLMNTAANLKIDTCPLEGIDPAQYDEILNMASYGLETTVACALGIRSSDDKYQKVKKVRFSHDDVFVHLN